MEKHFDDGTEPTILPHYSRCSGPCQQGRRPCPHPYSCEVPIEEPDFYGREHWKEYLVDAVFAAAVCGVVMTLAVVILTRWAA